jgi:hypothetical protein
MVLGSDPQQFELSVVEVERAVSGIYAGGDVLIVVRVRLRDFSGAADAWILRESWSDFLSQLRRLEQNRTGEAIVESLSPGELRVRVFALDRAGHMGVEGELTSYYSAAHRPEVTTLKFGAIEIDPTALPAFVRELEIAAPAV